MKITNLLAATSLTIIGMGATVTALAASKADINTKVTETLAEFNGLNSSNQSLTEKSAGMLVFPRVTKAGVGIAGEHGEGVLQVHGKTVDYYTVSAASVGLTLGVAKRSEIIMFMTKDSLDKFTKGEGWSIGADAGITIIHASANGEYGTQTEQKPILGFMFADKGLLGDLSLEGEKISKLKE